MAFLVQTLSKHSVILATIKPPSLSDDPVRVYKALNDKIARRSENDTIHIVLDMLPLYYDPRHASTRFVKVINKIYETWHYQRTLVLWFAVNEQYIDTVTYMVQKLCLPVYIRSDKAQIFQQIDSTFGQTGVLAAGDIQG